MVRRWRGTVLIVLLAAFPLAGCEDPPENTVPDPVQVTTTFDGSLPVNAAITHRFTTTSRGEITVTLEALSPAGTPTVAIALGVWTGASCNLIISNLEAAAGAKLVGTGNEPGQFCARIADVGRLTSTATYTIKVTYF
jgi:hypothetical protein